MAKKTLAIVRQSVPVLVASIEKRIYLVRGQKVMLDADLAELYHVRPHFPLERASQA